MQTGVTSIENSENLKERQRINEILKEKIKEDKNPKKCYEELHDIIKGEMFFLIYNKRSYDLKQLDISISEMIEIVTNDLFRDIKIGKFDNKKINLELYCHAKIYDAFADFLQLDKNEMQQIRRTRKLCEKYNIEQNPIEAHKICRLSNYDGKARPLSLGDAFHSLLYLMQREHGYSKRNRRNIQSCVTEYKKLN